MRGIYILFSLAITIVLACLAFLFCRLQRFTVIKNLAVHHKALSWIASLLLVALFCLYMARHVMVGIIVLLHLTVFWILSDFLGYLVHRGVRFYWQGILAIAVTFLYLGIGWYLAHHVVETHYQLETQKDIGSDSLRIVQISDSHMGSTFGGEDFAGYMEEIAKTEPDLVVVTGDYVDDDSHRDDMLIATQALGRIDTTYGIYFAYGNHDKGYRLEGYRDFTDGDLRKALLDNGIVILEDEVVQIGDGFLLVGRKDRSEEQRGQNRLSMAAITKDLDLSKYVIVLDHQPNDYDAQEASGVDLVLSGHTHGGQMIPIGWIGTLIGANDKTYGLERRGNTDFIVNAGISDWAIPFKTGTVAEYGVIDIVKR